MVSLAVSGYREFLKEHIITIPKDSHGGNLKFIIV